LTVIAPRPRPGRFGLWRTARVWSPTHPSCARARCACAAAHRPSRRR